MRTLCTLTGLVLCAGLLNAQDLVDPTPETAVPAYQPMTLKQNYAWSLGEIFGPSRMVTVAVQSGLDQLRSHDDGWGSHASFLGIRAASWFGEGFVRQNIAFGIRAVDGEDPRYVRSGKGSALERTRYAVKHTFLVRGRDGEDMPAYSLLADGATPFISQSWRHGAMRGGKELRAGSIVLGSTVVTNIGREFWPDIKKKLRH